MVRRSDRCLLKEHLIYLIPSTIPHLQPIRYHLAAETSLLESVEQVPQANFPKPFP